jgi:hypothetical protein
MITDRSCVLLTLLCVASLLSAADLTRDDLMGHWGLDAGSATAAQKSAAERAAGLEMFGLVLTNRIGRAVWSADGMVSGMWRLEDATETTGTIVIQSKAGEEQRYRITVTPDPKDKTLTRMTVAEAPDGLPLKRHR